MAFVKFTEDPTFPFMYNVTMAVGKDSANKRDDVMLVQYCLKHIWANPTRFSPALPPPPKGDMTVDGICGPTTRRWIVEFQIHSIRRGHAVAVDGIVDSLKDSTISSISQTTYTIALLNSALKQARPDLFQNIALDPEAPAELKLALGLVLPAVVLPAAA